MYCIMYVSFGEGCAGLGVSPAVQKKEAQAMRESHLRAQPIPTSSFLLPLAPILHLPRPLHPLSARSANVPHFPSRVPIDSFLRILLLHIHSNETLLRQRASSGREPARGRVGRVDFHRHSLQLFLQSVGRVGPPYLSEKRLPASLPLCKSSEGTGGTGKQL